MLNSRQRAQLRGMANGYESIVHIGKGGLTDQILKQAADALEARELIKCSVLPTAGEKARYFADKMAEEINADVVQVIGAKFILYKESKENKTIVLVK